MRVAPESGAIGRVVDHLGDTPMPRLLRHDDLDAVLALQDRVVRAAPPGRVRERTAATITGYLNASHGLAFGVAGAAGTGSLDAVGLLHLPSTSMPNGTDGMPRVPMADWPLETALLLGGMVHPERRGTGLQRRLIDCRRRAAAAAGMRWVCSGVLLFQVASIANLLRTGFVITGIRDEAAGPVLALAASAPGDAIATDAGEQVWIGYDDAHSIARLLADGFAGVRLTLDSLLFERLIPSLTLRTAAASGSVTEPTFPTA